MEPKLTLYEKTNKEGVKFGFENLKYIGQGRQSVCFEAEHDGIVRIVKKLKSPSANSAAFRRAFETNRSLLVSSGNSVSWIYGYFYDENNCPYIVTEKITGKTLQETQFADLHGLLKVAVRLAMAIHQVHQAGYLCIDLSPDNVLVLPDNAGLFGAILFDFDSMVEISAVGELKGVASTKVFASPELIRKEFSSLCRQSDYYSFASLLYNTIYGYFPIAGMRTPNQKARPQYQSLLESSVVIRDTLEEFWKNTLALYPQNRYSDFGALLNCVKRLCDLSHPNLQRNVRSNFRPDPGKNYVRTEQLGELKKFFRSRKDAYAVGIIHGNISGCGKSTLAQAVASEMEGFYDCVQWCTYGRKGFSKGFKGILEQIELADSKAEINEKEAALKRGSQRVLIVVDGFDEEKSKQALPRWGNCHILFTSKQFVPESFEGLIQTGTCVRVDMDCSEALGRAVFQNVYRSLSGRHLSDEQWQDVGNLLEAVKYHTYACDLIACALAEDISPSTIKYIWDEKVKSRKDIQPGHGSVEATVEAHINALFEHQIKRLIRGKSGIERELLFFLSLDGGPWHRELLCTLVGDDPDRRRKKAKYSLQRMITRNLIKEEERFCGTCLGRTITVHPLAQMAIKNIFARKRKWNTQEHILRGLFNLYASYLDDIHTEALATSSWPRGFKDMVADITIGKLKELQPIGTTENSWMHYVSLLHWTNKRYISPEIKELLCLNADETYYTYLITENETIFFVHAGGKTYPLLGMKPIYPQEDMPDTDQLNFEMCHGEVSIRLVCCSSLYQQELAIPSDICGNPVCEVMGVAGCPAKVVHIPEGVLYIGADAFIGSIATEQITLPISIKAIYDYAFMGSSIREIHIPSAVQIIGAFAFSECKDLERVTIESKKVYIGYGAFDGCSNLREVRIRNNVVLDDSAFWNCDNIKRIVASKEWKKKHIHIIEALPGYEPEDEEERKMIEEYREETQNPINVALQWSDNDCKVNGENLDEDAFRQTIGEMLTSLGVDEVS